MPIFARVNSLSYPTRGGRGAGVVFGRGGCWMDERLAGNAPRSRLFHQQRYESGGPVEQRSPSLGQCLFVRNQHLQFTLFRFCSLTIGVASFGERKRGSGGDKSHFVGSLGRLLFLSRSPSGAQRELQAELLGGALLPDLVSERAAASNRPAQGVQLAFRLHCVYQTNPIPRTRYRPVAQPPTSS